MENPCIYMNSYVEIKRKQFSEYYLSNIVSGTFKLKYDSIVFILNRVISSFF